MIEAAVNPTTRKGVSISRFEIIKTDNLLLQAWQRLSDGLAALIVTPGVGSACSFWSRRPSAIRPTRFGGKRPLDGGA
jgi:hypothetical protein